jgi:hypothetical protein
MTELAQELCVGKDAVGRSSELTERIIPEFSGRTEENHEKLWLK